MLVLFDHGTPAPLRAFLKDHTVKKTKDLGWDTLSNGELLRAAEEAAFQILLTTDKNIRYQQNLAERHCDRGLGPFAMACVATVR
jgi:hypothetical protein